MPFVVLGLLLYGKYSSVVWSSPTTCRIRARAWGSTIGVTTTNMRAHLEWLKRQHYLTALVIEHGYITVTVTPPPVRGLTAETAVCHADATPIQETPT